MAEEKKRRKQVKKLVRVKDVGVTQEDGGLLNQNKDQRENKN